MPKNKKTEETVHIVGEFEWGGIWYYIYIKDSPNWSYTYPKHEFYDRFNP